MFTYFSNIRTGLILDTVYVFGLLAYTISQSLQKGIEVGPNVYFWLLWPVIMNTAITGYVWHNKSLDKENESMRNRLEHFVTIDEDTQMNIFLPMREMPEFTCIFLNGTIWSWCLSCGN